VSPFLLSAICATLLPGNFRPALFSYALISVSAKRSSAILVRFASDPSWKTPAYLKAYSFFPPTGYRKNLVGDCEFK
jgi:hypothetical protein